MSENTALESERETLIKEMMDMQKQFIELERGGGYSQQAYYRATDGMLKDYRTSYMEKALRVSEISRKLIHGH